MAHLWTLFELTFMSFLVLVSCQNPMKTFWGNAGGASCVFPFKYRGQMYQNCTVLDNKGKPWCATTPDYDADGRWGRCDMRIPGKRTTGGNGGGQDCVFPFQYNGERFDDCIYRDHHKPWCSTTGNFPNDKKWGNCISFMAITTTGGNSAAQAQCVFPFMYRGELRSGCLVDDGSKGSWCATTGNFDRDALWAKCVLSPESAGICSNSYQLYSDKYSLNGIPVRSAKTKDDCQNECNMRSACVGYDFNNNPSIEVKCQVHTDLSNFRSRNDARGIDEYVIMQRCASSCDNQYERLENTLSYGGSDVAGAYTIPDCSKVCGETSNCFGFDYDANPSRAVKCFIHNSMDNFGSRRTAEYVMEFVVTRKVCSSVLTEVGNNNAPRCYFPYKYRGMMYSTCNSRNWHKPWCATTPDYDRDGQWGDCNLPAQ